MGPAVIDVADRLAIHELLGLYGHLIDERRWSELDQVFTEDIVFDSTDLGHGVIRSLEALRQRWAGDESIHPLAHHATNIVVTQDPDGVVRVLSKGIGVGPRGRVGSVVYRDVVVRVGDGWRLARREARLRRPDRPLSGTGAGSLAGRVGAVEARLAIGQLPVRYALAIDQRDLDSLELLWGPDVDMGRHGSGRAALRQFYAPLLTTFYRSVHQICGHRIELDAPAADGVADSATGHVYCRAEHEVGDRWIVMAIRYDDEYRRIDGEWFFRRRREHHWYKADVAERPPAVDFDSWGTNARPPALPQLEESWSAFWRDRDPTNLTGRP